MPKRRALLLAVALAPLSAELLAQAPAVDHSGVGCVVADRFPVIEARFSPQASVGRARVYFRAAGTAAWYFVDMQPAGGGYRGVLPRPRKSIQAIDYYVEVVDTELRSNRSADFKPAVVGSREECRGGMTLAMSLTTAKLVVGAASGAASVPAGFASAGVTAAGSAGTAGAGAAAGAGGLSTGLVVGLVAAGAAGVGAAVVKSGGDDQGSSSSGGAPPPATQLTITFTPGIDVSVCGGANSFSAQGVTLRSDGSFDETWSPSTPNVMRATGRADASSLQATLTCASRPGPTGSLSASGSGYNMTGTFSFGNAAATPNTASQGAISVRRQQ
jgi:hypothetical protein